MDDTLQVFPYAWQQQKLLRNATVQIVLGCRVLEGFAILHSYKSFEGGTEFSV
jgi:hypothetical protein